VQPKASIVSRKSYPDSMHACEDNKGKRQRHYMEGALHISYGNRSKGKNISRLRCSLSFNILYLL
jgi:hypothetical protein